MPDQNYDNLQEEPDPSVEDSSYLDEPEFDEETLRSNERRSRFFFAAMSILIAMLFLSMDLNHVAGLNSTILQLGTIVFISLAIYLLLRGGSTVNKKPLSVREELVEHSERLKDGEDGIEQEEIEQPSLTPFEILVQEALASIPAEFQERMNNVYVHVVYEPGDELVHRVGTKEGYTLLGLYEGVPLTVYGRHYSTHPETITIFQHTIERYCHGDPDRIREQVQRTVLHEVAHHFGIDHDEMPIWIK